MTFSNPFDTIRNMKIKSKYTLKQLSNLVRSKEARSGKIQVMASTTYGYGDDYEVVEDICGLTKKQWEESGDSLEDWNGVKGGWFFCLDGIYYSFNQVIRDVKIVQENKIKIV